MSHQQNVTITAPNGLHMRPATELAKAGKTFKSTMTVTFNHRNANLKRPLDLLALGLKKDSVVTIQAEGEDAKKAVEHVVQLLHDIAEREKAEHKEEHKHDHKHKAEHK